MIWILLVTSAALAGATVGYDTPRDAYRDAAGNLLVTFIRRDRDQSAGTRAGAMFCTAVRCVELNARVAGDDAVSVTFDRPGGRGRWTGNSKTGLYQLGCGDRPPVDLRPVSREDLGKLGEALRGARIGFTPAPVRRALEFAGRGIRSENYVYVDSDEGDDRRVFTGRPGAMKAVDFTRLLYKCGWRGCREKLRLGGHFGLGGSLFERIEGGATLDGEPLVDVTNSTTAASLGVPPNPAVTNPVNPCDPAPAPPPANAPPPATAR